MSANVILMGQRPPVCAVCGSPPSYTVAYVPGVVFLHTGDCEREWRTAVENRTREIAERTFRAKS